MGGKAFSFLTGMSLLIGMSLLSLPAVASATSLGDLPDDANQLVVYVCLASGIVAVILLAVYVSRYNAGEGRVPVVFSPWNLIYLVMFGLMFASRLHDHSRQFRMIAMLVVLILLAIRLYLNIRATYPALGTAITAYQVVLCFLGYALGVVVYSILIGGLR